MTYKFLEALLPIIRDAGTLIEQIRQSGATTRIKSDRSPVTEADERAEALIVAALRNIDPDTLIVGEEACEAGAKPAPEKRFWLLDPLDGTKSFIDGGPDYSVNIGLIDNGEPVFGIVMAPRSGTIWAGAKGIGAWRYDGDEKTDIRCRTLPTRPVVVTSRSHIDSKTERYVAAIPGADVKPSGSSLKFCMIADGTADIYPRFGPTSEWDTAAAHAVLLGAGGAMYNAEGLPFRYGKPDYMNGPFLAIGDPAAYGTLPRVNAQD